MSLLCLSVLGLALHHDLIIAAVVGLDCSRVVFREAPTWGMLISNLLRLVLRGPQVSSIGSVNESDGSFLSVSVETLESSR